ncbi:putative bifunctional diguanylate cyclase/phosphodiesterase, partial [Halomonas sp.]|uniref:putative bifunctional diguanylate cyclase/phosphodiesterase n=1 Tax=Halomonas sp. TaxID=1486246 RepID=UPI003568A709
GAHFAVLLVPEDLPRIQGFFDAARAGESSHYELEIIVSNGERRALELLNLPIMVDGVVRGVYGIAKDITERRRNETRLRVLERGVQASINGVVIADATQPDLPIIYANATFVKMTGYSLDEVLGRNCRFLQGEDTDLEALEAIRDALSERHDVHITLRNYRKDGSPFWNDLYISPIPDAEGLITHFVGVQHDVSEHKAYEAQLAHHASHDALTGLANRALFEDRLDHDFALARRHGYRLAVLFIDLDDFKPINDSLGHAVGDRVLRELARRMQSAMRAGDTLARLGGDEFVVLVPDIDQDMQVTQLVERLLPLIARPYRIDGHELYLTGSVGIAISDKDILEPRELIQQADMAMYQAKQQGRNAYQWFTPEITDKVGERVALRNDLQEAIDGQHFELHYQPLIDRDGEVSGVEALLRWPHPRRGYISPADFIPLAESTGQIIPISQWVLDRACRDMCGLSEKGLGEVRVAVNLSPLQFHRASFLSSLCHTLQSIGLAPSRLELELTEGILMNRTETAIDILKALRSMQIGVSIDDFGTGFSSLSYLKYLPIGKVKIDRSFIHELSTSEQDAAIVQGIIS